MITPIIENIGKNETDRILPFTMWIDFPFSTSPYFEIMFVIQILSLYGVGICYFCFDCLLCIMNIHTAGQFRILQYRLIKIYQENDNRNYNHINHLQDVYNRFKGLVIQHQMLIKYSKDLNHVFTFITLGQVLIFSILICLVGYEIFIAEAAPIRRAVFIFYIIGTMTQLMMFTYSCNILTEESMNIAVAAYSSSWTSMPINKIGKLLRKGLFIIIIRAQKPCVLSAGGFFSVSLETYTAVISTAMSYFTLLRQRSLEVIGV
ncbi:odorant receptor 13a-like [Vespa mandarinia]|uniref:odorant receptor 13a-like n=1 Tax=Vespa mandarinia TaxID=7446 RepID=UPI0016135143|nr:odorant receptor 13a-like [Vespa mandarinia]